MKTNASPTSETNERQIPASACTFAAELVIREPKSETDKSRPFTGIARTGDAVRSPFFFGGRIVHDLSGMRHKSHIPIDFNHNVNEVIGFANKFSVDGGNLEISGALTPSEFEGTRRTQEIIDKGAQGVPWELSINFAGDFEVDEIPAGQEVNVNDRVFSGPISVVRSWPLRGVAVTPYGKDDQTSLHFAEGDTVTYLVRKGEQEMSVDTTETVEAEVQDTETKAEDTERDNAEVKDAQAADQTDDAAPKEPEATPPPPAAELTNVPTGRDYMAKFGRVQGALYFAEGISMDDAMAKELERLQTENAELRAKARAERDDLDEAVSFSSAPDSDDEPDVWNEIPGANLGQAKEKPKVSI